MEQLMKNIVDLGMISIFNIIIAAVLLLPGIVFMFRTKRFRKHTSNKVMMILEHVGRIACVLLMVFPFPKSEFGFPSTELLLVYLFVNGFGLVLYIALCASFFKKPNAFKAAVLAFVPVALFAVCGITLQHYLLVFAAVLYGIGHLYRTIADSKNRYSEAKQLEKEKKAEEAAKAAQEAQQAATMQQTAQQVTAIETAQQTAPEPQPEQ